MIIDVNLKYLKFVVVIFSMFQLLMYAYSVTYLCILHKNTYLLLQFSLENVYSLDVFNVCVITTYCVMSYDLMYVTL